MNKKRIIERSAAKAIALVLTLLLPSACIQILTPAEPPYPRSPIISGINWDFDSLMQLAPGSDLWPVTWGADGHLYTSWGDGGGFGGTNQQGRVSLGFARIEGSPDNFSGTNIWGGFNAENPATFTGKCAGLLSVDGTLYAWINMQNGHPPDVRLAWSSDLGKRWQLSRWAFPKSGAFFPNTFLNFGRDYQDAIDNYIYFYGARWIWAQGPENDIFLARAPKARLLDRTTYEFFVGFDGAQEPLWDQDVDKRQPVFTDPNGVGNRGQANVVYNAGINRFLMTVAHRSPLPGSVANDVKRLGVFDAPRPWGPWTTAAYHENWGGFGETGEALGYHLPVKWIEDNGRTMWMVFSSTGVLDSFNLIRLELTLK